MASQLRGAKAGQSDWVVGRWARAKAADAPGRVAQSAKSWLGHHAVDRSAPFLPWGSEDVAAVEKISPVRASALILAQLRDAWNERFASAGAPDAFDAQAVTITVPASFDAAAQRLTLDAAAAAGFPGTVRLLEEPQAAFYRWLERHDSGAGLWQQLAGRGAGPHHVLIVDVGGGTTDLSLFELHADVGRGGARIKRIAVSDHILLGGDNMDLALAHRLEPRLANDGERLAGNQWGNLVARSRDVKERALSANGLPDEAFTVAIPARGAGLIAGLRCAQLTRAEIDALVLDGFFPECYADERPLQLKSALGEWGLPYAPDPAITRHLADFLRDRPAVDAVLFNGGALQPARVRERIRGEIAKWQNSAVLLVLENAEPDLAVALGAAHFGRIAHVPAKRIEAGTARAIFLEAHRAPAADDGEPGEPSLVCVLPKDAAPDVTFEISDLPLELRINRPVSFRTFYSNRDGAQHAGDVVDWNERDFHPLPPLETVARTGDSDGTAASRAVPVRLTAKLNDLGLLEISCRSTDPAVRRSWPLEFNLRAPGANGGGAAGSTLQSAGGGEAGPNVRAAALEAGRVRIETIFGHAFNPRDKLTATRLIKSLETILGVPKSDWNVILVRSLWSTLEACATYRRNSVEHEEAWLILAGFLLRPGFGAPMDDVRIDALWQVRESGLFHPSKAVKLQEYILWRRVAGGLSRQRQQNVIAPELEKLRAQPSPPPELVLLAGSLERLDAVLKTELVERFIAAASTHAAQNKHFTHFLAALGSLLNRTPLYAGPETVVSRDLVAEAFDTLGKLDWSGPKLIELQALFVRAARVVNDRSLDVPQSLRNRIADKLERAGVPAAKTAPIRHYLAMERAERVGLFGESLPPGLILRNGLNDRPQGA